MDPTSCPSALRDAGTGEITEHVQALRRYARTLVSDPSDADDLVQESLKRALHYLRDGREVGNLRGYLFRILQNTRKDMLRRNAQAGVALPIEDVSLASGDPPVADRVSCNQVVAAMRRLPEQQREVLFLVAIEGASYREVAEIVDVPIGTVMSRLNRARAGLRRILDPEGLLDFESGD